MNRMYSPWPARALVYCGVFALGSVVEDWRNVGWSFNLAMAALAFFAAFIIKFAYGRKLKPRTMSGGQKGGESYGQNRTAGERGTGRRG